MATREIREKRKFRRLIGRRFATVPEINLSHEELESAKTYFKDRADEGFVIDDITWNDLSFDDIFRLINNSYSSVGDSVLYDMLRHPETID